MAADGEILSVAGRHADVASLIAHRATDTGAGVIVVGRPAERASLTDLVTREAPVNVLVVA